jgi:hypothetical protein
MPVLDEEAEPTVLKSDCTYSIAQNPQKYEAAVRLLCFQATTDENSICFYWTKT